MNYNYRKEKAAIYSGIGAFLAFLLAVGLLLNWRMGSLLDSNVCHGLNMASRVQAELMDVKLEGELNALEKVSKHISSGSDTWQESINQGDIKYMRDTFVREGIMDIYGNALYGAVLRSRDYPGLRDSIRGNRAVCYSPLSGVLFSVPVFNGDNVVYVLTRRIDKGGIDQYFHLNNNDALGESVIVSRDGEMMFAADESYNAKAHLDDPEVRQIYKELALELRTHKSAARRFTLDGHQMYASAAGIWDGNFVLFSLITAEAAYAGVTNINNLVIMVFAFLMLLFSCGIYMLLKEKSSKQKLEQERAESMWHMSMRTVMTLAKAIDAKDKYTNGHSERVAKYSMMLAERLGFDHIALEKLRYIALLHDVGKIGIKDEILNKNGKLTDEEYRIIQSHPAIGARILADITEIPDVSVGAEFHHERYDGKGYPNHIKGEAIPLIGRIIAVADTYDAMTSNRSYRKALSQEAVRSEFVRCSGTQFDPDIAKLMIQIMDEDKNYDLRSK